MLNSVTIGSVLLGKYRVDGVIGEGGMGIVYLAFHLQLHERVALKFPKREALRLAGAAARFLTEARAAIRIKSEHVARVIDVGTLDDGTPFIVMEYVEGETLSQYAAREAPLATAKIVEYVTQISEAISEAHALGIVHRDLKPANIILTRRADGILAAKVLDFGISQVADATWAALASSDHLEVALGSPAYASPEQLQSPDRVDARSDIWSLGVIMYELAAGQLPFVADTTVALCGKVVFDPFVSLCSIRPDFPRELSETIGRCLQKRPAERHSSVGQLAAELLPFASARAVASIERIVRTVDARGKSASDVTATLIPFVQRDNGPLLRGMRTVTTLVARHRVRSATWLILTAVFAALLGRGWQSSRSRTGVTAGEVAAHATVSTPVTGAPSQAIETRPQVPDNSVQPAKPVSLPGVTVRKARARSVATSVATSVLPPTPPTQGAKSGESYFDDPAYSNRK